MIRKATEGDFADIATIYDMIHGLEEQGRMSIGWKRGIYPADDTIRQALNRNDMFVFENDGDVACKDKILAAAVINHMPLEAYGHGKWQYPADYAEIMVLHTLVVNPNAAGNGIGRKFVSFYEHYAKECGCKYLRMDTQEKNTFARRMYSSLGYSEVSVETCVFGELGEISLVLLEKKIG